MLHSDSVGLNLFWYSFVLKLYVMVETGDHCQLKMAGKTSHFGDRICLSKRTRRFTRYTSGSHVLCVNVEQSRNDSGIAFAGTANGCTSKEVTEIGPSWHFKGGGESKMENRDQNAQSGAREHPILFRYWKQFWTHLMKETLLVTHEASEWQCNL